MKPIDHILDLARWAPSGDNTQPWRFEVTGDASLVVHGFDTREHCVYDLDGHPSQIAIGALLETMAIAASTHGWAMRAVRRTGLPDTRPTFDVGFVADAGVRPDPLAACIARRSVQRRAMRTRALTVAEKQALERAAGPAASVVWLDGNRTKLRTALLMFRSARLRLTLPEAYRVHRDVIEWHARYSEDRVPDQALGVDPLTTRLMQFVMHSWQRVAFFNAWLAGTWAPRLQMDLLPGIACGAHFVLLGAAPPAGIDDYVAAGRAVQRVWLTVTRLGLVMQPELTPLIFARYVRDDVRFSATAGMVDGARRIADGLDALIGSEPGRRALFMARCGAGSEAKARSLRRPLDRLVLGGDDAARATRRRAESAAGRELVVPLPRAGRVPPVPRLDPVPPTMRSVRP